MTTSQASDTLGSALARHAIELPDDQISRLEAYCRALWDWNERLNLTRHTDFEKFVTRDVIDSLALSPLIESGERVLDVGTGGGVPGVILAITRPDLEVVMCESMAKKARAVEDIIGKLQLPTKLLHARAETILEQEDYDTLVIRAVAPLAKLMTWFAPYRGAFEQMLVIKGPNWTAERAESREHRQHVHFNMRKVADYTIPATGAESVVLRIWPRDVPEFEEVELD